MWEKGKNNRKRRKKISNNKQEISKKNKLRITTGRWVKCKYPNS